MIVITNINPASQALKFLEARLASDSYRGVESSQHNRYKVNDVHTILSIFDKYAPNQKLLRIRTADTSKRRTNLPEEYDYANFCHESKQATGIGTQDAMRKNLFVDWHRMGLINRYDRDGHIIAPYARGAIVYVSLSDLGLQFIREGNLANQAYIFAKALNKLLSGFVENTLNLLSTTSLDWVDFNEFMFFVSAINHPVYGIDLAQCELLINDYRNLTRLQRSTLIDTLKIELDPSKFQGDKTDKRDFHNWVNKYQQIWYLFNQVPFFIIDNSDGKMKLYLSSANVSSSSYNRADMRRSVRAKNDYFTYHAVRKTKGYELDHIIPLLTANSIEEFGYLDRWENLLYIDGKTHAIKTQSGSKHCQLLFNPSNFNEISLRDFQNHSLIIRNGHEALFDPKQIPKISDYNTAFLESTGR